MFDRFFSSSRHRRYDIAYIGDFRYANDATELAAEEIAAQARAGYSTLLVQTSATTLRGNPPIRPSIRACVARGEASVHDPADGPAEARLAVLHEPISLAPPVDPRPELRSERAVFVANGPVYDTGGTARFSPVKSAAAVEDWLGCSPEWAPAWPNIRRQLRQVKGGPALLGFDWSPIIGAIGGTEPSTPPPSLTPQGQSPRGRVPRVGRHSRPDERLWPESFEELLHVYPVSDTLDVALLGLPWRLLQPFAGYYPSNWTLYESDSLVPDRFLRSIDFFLHAENRRWPNLVGRNVLEALANDVVTVLPPAFAALFGEACVYANPGWASLKEITRLHRDEEAFQAQVEQGRELLAERFGPERHVERLATLIGRPARAAKTVPQAAPIKAPATSRNSARPVLFTATNGIGLGHLTQLLAIAKRVPSDIQPIFATMSQATALVRAAGYPAHFFPDYRYVESPYGQWNRWLEVELTALVEFYGAEAIVFDGVIPYDGILRAGARSADLPMVWVRIPMWKRALWDQSVERAKFFDLVLDTGELAEAHNVGARIPYEDKLEVIPPMLLCDEEELLPREEARAALGLNQHDPAVLLQLGSGNNQALVPVVQHIVATLEDLGIRQIVIADWVIAEHPLETWPSVTMLRHFPNSHYLKAFDFVVSAAGYNTFHELIGYGLPSLFVPNERVETDDQLGRSRYAEDEGLGLCMAVSELDNFESHAQRLLNPAEQARITAACRQRRWHNGAAVAAERLAELI